MEGAGLSSFGTGRGASIVAWENEDQEKKEEEEEQEEEDEENKKGWTILR
jgi:ribosomal protein L12E/L44/L45/RPP1/RPP2